MNRNAGTMRRKENARLGDSQDGRKGSEMKTRGHYTSIRDYATGAIAAIVAMVGIEGLLQLAYVVQAARHGWGA